VENLFSIRSHPSEQILEEYAFNRLTEEQTASVEEHLLLCESCQVALAEIDEYRTAMKTVAVAVAKPPLQDRFKLFWRGLWGSPGRRRLVWATAGAMAGVLALAYVSLRPAVPVVTISFRGGQDINNAVHAPARTPLELQIPDLKNANSSSYRIEIANLSGKLVWEGPPSLKGSILQVSLPKGLSKGLYWFRLYSPGQLEYEVTLRTE